MSNFINKKIITECSGGYRDGDTSHCLKQSLSVEVFEAVKGKVFYGRWVKVAKDSCVLKAGRILLSLNKRKGDKDKWKFRENLK